MFYLNLALIEGNMASSNPINKAGCRFFVLLLTSGGLAVYLRWVCLPRFPRFRFVLLFTSGGLLFRGCAARAFFSKNRSPSCIYAKFCVTLHPVLNTTLMP